MKFVDNKFSIPIDEKPNSKHSDLFLLEKGDTTPPTSDGAGSVAEPFLDERKPGD
jgi:hypothetical protein